MQSADAVSEPISSQNTHICNDKIGAALIPARARPRSHLCPPAPRSGLFLFTIIRSRSAGATRVAITNFCDCCGAVTCLLPPFRDLWNVFPVVVVFLVWSTAQPPGWSAL